MEKWMKFSDIEFLILYILGFSDRKIAKILGVSRSTVRERRMVLGLIPIHKAWRGEEYHTKKEVIEAKKRRIKKHEKYTKNWRLRNKERYKEWDRLRWHKRRALGKV